MLTPKEARPLAGKWDGFIPTALTLIYRGVSPAFDPHSWQAPSDRRPLR
jgi:hypothetical protein